MQTRIWIALVAISAALGAAGVARPIGGLVPARPAPAAAVNAVAVAASRALPSSVHANWLEASSRAVDTAVTVYGDCSGQAPVPLGQAAVDTCVSGRLYFVGHNPGVFGGLLDAQVGTRLTYYDQSGRAHSYAVVKVRDWRREAGVPPPATGAVVAQFQTCVTPDGSIDRILDAVSV